MAAAQTPGAGRVFLFLQGPHGPYFHKLAQMLSTAGATCWRAGFTAGDAAFWPDSESYLPQTGPLEAWPDALRGLFARLHVTDIVLYGDTRPVHAAAVAEARAQGLGIHVFEEGYLRPYWVTYERGGTNGNSPLMALSIDQMRAALGPEEGDMPDAPARWGDLRQHVAWGALYHALVLVGNRRYRGYRPHRDITVGREFRLYLRRLVTLPVHALQRFAASRQIRGGSFPYHIVLLQLAHDASFRANGHFARMEDFVDHVIDAFAEGAPGHHHLVFKAHPLEDGREPLPAMITRAARRAGVAARVHFVRGGKLASLLDLARSAVTVNSTAAQQALWRGLPVRSFGASVYDHPELVSRQPLSEFFADPTLPDMEAYRTYRRFLLASSQVTGGFYSARGRARLLRRVPDMMLAPRDPYQALFLAAGGQGAGPRLGGPSPQPVHLRLVR
ncbi:MAG: capsule biosynthesis protein CapA [Rhodobacteraceae bacterium]|nr:capsule biosynthesis protein CapA [Paracoccaceae bacterium]